MCINKINIYIYIYIHSLGRHVLPKIALAGGRSQIKSSFEQGI